MSLSILLKLEDVTRTPGLQNIGENIFLIENLKQKG